MFNTLKVQAAKSSNFRNLTLFGYKFQEFQEVDFANFQKLTFYAALMLPFDGLEYQLQYNQHQSRTISATHHILVSSLVQSKQLYRFVTDHHEYIRLVNTLIETYSAHSITLKPEQTLDLALILRKIGPNYASASMLHIASQYERKRPRGPLSHKETNLHTLKQIIEKHIALNRLIEMNRLRDVHLVKPIIDGKALKDLYQCRPGKHMKSFLKEAMEYQLLHLEASKEEIEEYMLDN